jgi:hypothetical protein
MAYIKFAEKDAAEGLFYLAVRMPLQGYRGEILKVPDVVLPHLRQQGFEFEEVARPSGDGTKPGQGVLNATQVSL